MVVALSPLWCLNLDTVIPMCVFPACRCSNTMAQILICCFCLKLLQQHHFDIKLPFLPSRSADVCDSVGLLVALSHPLTTLLSSSISPSVHHTCPCCPLRLLSLRSSSLYMLLFFLILFSLVLHCVSVSGVTSVVLPYGRWHHAVLPQGRTTDGMLGGVCVRQSIHPPP